MKFVSINILLLITSSSTSAGQEVDKFSHLRQRTNRTCGGGSRGNGICPIAGECCSEFGWCGISYAHCSNNVPAPGPTPPTGGSNGTCGSGSRGNGICPIAGECCSEFGWCGTSYAHCNNNVPAPKNTRKWALKNISKSLPDEVWKALLSNDTILVNIMVGVLLIPVAYIGIHYLFTKFMNSYRELNSDAQTVVIHHTIEAIILSLFFFPTTYLTLSMLFEEQSLHNFEAKFVSLATLMPIILINYVVELASRFQNPRKMLVAHHIIAYSDGLFVLAFATTANVKAALLLTYFITFESISFIGLVLYRLHPISKLTSRMILIGLVVMGISRPIQVLLIFGFLISAWDELVTWHAIVQMIVTITVTAIQIWSLTIHYSLLQRSIKKRQHILGKEEDGKNNESSCQQLDIPMQTTKSSSSSDDGRAVES
jgi:hypothetical protein